MGVFSKKPERKIQAGQQVVLALPLTGHETTELAQLLAAIRSGERNETMRRLEALQSWPAARAVVAMRAMAGRYVRASMAALDGDGEADAQALVEAVHGALPAGSVRIEVIFNAVVLALADGEVAAGLVGEDTAGAVVALAHASAGCANLLRQRGEEPTVASILHGIAAPW